MEKTIKLLNLPKPTECGQDRGVHEFAPAQCVPLLCVSLSIHTEGGNRVSYALYPTAVTLHPVLHRRYHTHSWHMLTTGCEAEIWTGLHVLAEEQYKVLIYHDHIYHASTRFNDRLCYGSEISEVA